MNLICECAFLLKRLSSQRLMSAIAIEKWVNSFTVVNRMKCEKDLSWTFRMLKCSWTMKPRSLAIRHRGVHRFLKIWDYVGWSTVKFEWETYGREKLKTHTDLLKKSRRTDVLVYTASAVYDCFEELTTEMHKRNTEKLLILGTPTTTYCGRLCPWG